MILKYYLYYLYYDAHTCDYLEILYSQRTSYNSEKSMKFTYQAECFP